MPNSDVIPYQARFCFHNPIEAFETEISVYGWDGDMDNTMQVTTPLNPISSLPLAHLQTPFRDELMRMPSNIKFVIRIVFEELTPLSSVAILGHNLEKFVRVKAYDNPDFTNELYDSGKKPLADFLGWDSGGWDVDQWDKKIPTGKNGGTTHWWHEDIVAQSCELYFDEIDGQNPAFQPEISAIFWGEDFTCGKDAILGQSNFDWGSSFTTSYSGKHVRLASGDLLPTAGVAGDQFSASFSSLNKEDALYLFQRFNDLQTNKWFFCSWYPADSRLSRLMQGMYYLKTKPKLTHKHGQFFSLNLEVVSAWQGGE